MALFLLFLPFLLMLLSFYMLRFWKHMILFALLNFVILVAYVVVFKLTNVEPDAFAANFFGRVLTANIIHAGLVFVFAILKKRQMRGDL